jgi:hypothetical protein
MVIIVAQIALHECFLLKASHGFGLRQPYLLAFTESLKVLLSARKDGLTDRLGVNQISVAGFVAPTP